MKKYSLLLFYLICHSLSAQYNSFADIGVLFSQSEINGSARYTGLSGAMGALGGDLSSINDNPAGLATFNQFNFGFTLGTNTKFNNNTYYGNTNSNTDFSFEFNQIGVAGVIESDLKDWQKIAFGINYNKTNNFNNFFYTSGNSGFASFQIHPNDPNNTVFNIANEQFAQNEIIGNSGKVTFAIAAQHKNKLNLGASLNISSIDYTQKVRLNELNSNANNDVLDAATNQYDRHIATGVSLNLGLIYKPIQAFRIGASYETPTWYYQTVDEYNIYDGRTNQTTNRVDNGYTTIGYNGNVYIRPIGAIDGYSKTNTYLETLYYNLQTPDKITLSTALTLGKLALLSIDYSFKNYQNLQFNSSGYERENIYFKDYLQNTQNVKAGGELRIKDLTLRSGVYFEQSPFKNIHDTNLDAVSLGNKYGGSLGAGLRIGNTKFDLTYQQSRQLMYYDFYDQYIQVAPTAINQKNSRVLLTYSFVF